MTFDELALDLINSTDKFTELSGEYRVANKADIHNAETILKAYYKNVEQRKLDYANNDAEGIDYLIKFDTPLYNFDLEESIKMNEEYEKRDKNMNVEEAIEKHDTLNPKLWDGDKLKPEVEAKLREIVQKFDDNLKENGVELDVKDICIIGSNANYNYSPDSDVDLHIVADTSVYPDQEDLAMKVYLAYKSLFNNKYDPTINGIEVEIYVEPDDIQANSNGIYSLDSGWLKEPEQVDVPAIDPNHVQELIQPYEDRYNDIVNSDATVEDVDKLIDDIYLQRQQSIMRDGEFGDGNICFKEFRNRGYLQNLRDLKVELENKEMSLNTFDEGISNLYGLNEEDEVDLIPELKNYLKVGDKFREPTTGEVIEITDIDDDIVTYLSTPIDEEPYSVPVPRNILLANIAEFYEPIKEDVNEALSDDEFAKALEVNNDNAQAESDELGASFDQELSRLGVNAEDYDNYLDMYKRLDAQGKNVISDKIRSFDKSLTEDITEYPNGLEFNFSDPVSTLEVYLQWEGIIGYDWQIIEAYEDGGYDGLSEYLDEEGIYGYTENIRDILEGEPAYCSQMEMEDFESICRHLYISPEDAIAESVCKNVNESDEYSKLKELAIKNKGGLAGNINYCLDKIEDALDAGKINPAEASELSRILTECNLSEAFRVGDRFKSPINGVTVQLTKVDSDGDYAEYKEVGVDNPIIASTGHEGIANFFDGWKKVKYAPYPKNSPEYIKYNDFDEKIFEVWKNHEGVDAANEILAKAKEARDSGEIAPGHYGLLVQERNYLWNISEDLEEDDFIGCERVSESLNEAKKVGLVSAAKWALRKASERLKDKSPEEVYNRALEIAGRSEYPFVKNNLEAKKDEAIEFIKVIREAEWNPDLDESLNDNIYRQAFRDAMNVESEGQDFYAHDIEMFAEKYGLDFNAADRVMKKIRMGLDWHKYFDENRAGKHPEDSVDWSFLDESDEYLGHKSKLNPTEKQLYQRGLQKYKIKTKYGTHIASCGRWKSLDDVKDAYKYDSSVISITPVDEGLLLDEDKDVKVKKLEESEVVNEGAAEEIAVHELKAAVADEIHDMLQNATSNLAQVIGSKIKEYNIDWCNDDGSNFSAERVETALNAAARALADDLFKNAPREIQSNESLEEDTVKQNGKWVNKGKDGTHGEFDTEEKANAQRKAMFANGYHEDLNEEADPSDPKAVALAEFEEVDLEDIDKDPYDDGVYTIGDSLEYFVGTEEEAHTRAVEEVKGLFDDMGLEAFTPQFQKEILMNCIDEDAADEFVESELDYFRNDEPDEDMVNYLENLTDKLQYVEDTLGPDTFAVWAKDKIDLDAVAEEAIKQDGEAHFIAFYDGNEVDLGNGLYAYRMN